MSEPLKKVTIIRDGDHWRVVREREATGESAAGLRTLEDAFDYVRALYDEHGDERDENTRCGI